MTVVAVATSREELLCALTLAVRLLSLTQVARGWCRGRTGNARRLLGPLCRAEWLRRIDVPARILPPPLGPACRWAPGEPTPDLGAVAYRLKRRGQGRAPRMTAAFVATSRAARLLGGHRNGTLKNAIQATHDLGLAEVYLHYREHRPELLPSWRGEELFAPERRGEKLPDALLVDTQDRPFRAVEYGGSYSRARLEAFHNDCMRRGLAYEVW